MRMVVFSGVDIGIPSFLETNVYVVLYRDSIASCRL